MKNIAKLEFAIGMAHALCDAIGIGVHSHVQEKVAEIIDTTETVRAFLRAMEADAAPWMGEGVWLSPQPCHAMRHWAPDAYQRVTDILQQLAAAGLMLTPTEADFDGAMRPLIDKYFQGARSAAFDRVRLFRLIWDFIGTQFGSRQILYERYFNGDVVRLRQGRFHSYDYSPAGRLPPALLARNRPPRRPGTAPERRPGRRTPHPFALSPSQDRTLSRHSRGGGNPEGPRGGGGTLHQPHSPANPRSRRPLRQVDAPVRLPMPPARTAARPARPQLPRPIPSLNHLYLKLSMSTAAAKMTISITRLGNNS